MKHLLTASIVVVGVIMAWAATGSSNHRIETSAHEYPQNCNTGVASFPVPMLDAPGSLPPVSHGSELRFRTRVSLPPLTVPEDATEVLCALSDVDVFVRLPGNRRFEHVCRLDVLNEGETRQCPERVVYDVDPLDAEDGRLRAQIRIVANIHDGDADCSTSPRKRNPMRVSDCIDATAVTSLAVSPADP